MRTRLAVFHVLAGLAGGALAGIPGCAAGLGQAVWQLSSPNAVFFSGISVCYGLAAGVAGALVFSRTPRPWAPWLTGGVAALTAAGTMFFFVAAVASV